MTPRDQLHELVDVVMPDDATRSQVHANVDTMSDADVQNEVERMETLRLLFEEQAQAYSAQPHDLRR
jgi:hypothetical protein